MKTRIDPTDTDTAKAFVLPCQTSAVVVVIVVDIRRR